jgi:selenocysteine-specific translation elongation factor
MAGCGTACTPCRSGSGRASSSGAIARAAAILTKVDQVAAGELPDLLGVMAAELERRPGAHPELLATSARTGAGIDRLRAELAALAAHAAEAPA